MEVSSSAGPKSTNCTDLNVKFPEFLGRGRSAILHSLVGSTEPLILMLCGFLTKICLIFLHQFRVYRCSYIAVNYFFDCERLL